MNMKIECDCHYCGYDGGYDIMRADIGSHTDNFKKYFAICGKCFATSSVCHTPEEVRELVTQNGPKHNPSKRGACIWCGNDDIEVENVNRHYMILRKQGYKQKMAMQKLPGIFYGICDSCQSCTAIKPTKHDAKEAIDRGSKVLPDDR